MRDPWTPIIMFIVFFSLSLSCSGSLFGSQSCSPTPNQNLSLFLSAKWFYLLFLQIDLLQLSTLWLQVDVILGLSKESLFLPLNRSKTKFQGKSCCWPRLSYTNPWAIILVSYLGSSTWLAMAWAPIPAAKENGRSVISNHAWNKWRIVAQMRWAVWLPG